MDKPLTKAQADRLYKSFPVLNVCRADFEGNGWDTSKATDEEIAHIARKMGDALMDNYWQDMDILAEGNLPKKDKGN